MATEIPSSSSLDSEFDLFRTQADYNAALGIVDEPDPEMVRLKTNKRFVRTIKQIHHLFHASTHTTDPVVIDQWISDPIRFIRLEACNILGAFFTRVPHAPDLAIHFIHDQDASVRREATRVFLRNFDNIPDPSLHIETLINNPDEDPDTKSTAIQVLEQQFNKFKEPTELVSDLMTNPHPEIRIKALEAFVSNLAAFNNPITWILPYEHDPSEDVKLTVASIISAVFPRTIPPDQIMHQFSQSPSAATRAAVMRITIPFYKRQLSRLSTWVHIGIHDPDPIVRTAALWALGKTYYSVVNHRELVKQCLEDPDPRVRAEASWIYDCATSDYTIRNNLGIWDQTKEVFNLDY